MTSALQDHSDDIRTYVDGVVSGAIVAGELVRAAVERYECDRYAGGARGLTFNADRANYAINFIELLKHSTGEFAGQQFILEPWQKFIVWQLFGWLNADGSRRFRWAFVSVARGNGKSPFAAAVANLLTFADLPREPRAQTYLYATKEKQAKDIVFAEVRNQIRSCSLAKSIKINSRRIHNNQESYIEPCGSDSSTNDGLIPHGAIIDELHEWQEWHRGLYSTIETGMHKRRSPLALQITTAGSDDSEIWAEQQDYSRQVVTGIIQADEHFSFIAQLDGQDDIFDEAVWPKANPNLGVSVKLERLRPMAAKAKHLPTAASAWRRYHCNLQTVSFYKLITREIWQKGSKTSDLSHEMGCYIGFDWGWRDDITALSLVWPLTDGEEELPQYAIDCHAWLPEDCKRDLTVEPWAGWIRDGLLTITPGNTTDIEAVYTKLEQLLEEEDIIRLAADPANCIEFLTKCVNYYGVATYEFRQTTRNYNEPTRYFVQALTEGRVYHRGHPLLGWCADNVTVKEDSCGYIMPNKQKSREKIDPIVATIMAIAAATAGDLPQYDFYLSNELELG